MAPEWLWLIDSAGLLVAPDDASGGARSVTYRVTEEAGVGRKMLNARVELRGTDGTVQRVSGGKMSARL